MESGIGRSGLYKPLGCSGDPRVHEVKALINPTEKHGTKER